MSRFEVTTLVLAPPPVVFDASLSVDVHTSSMGHTAERAVAGVTSGQLALGDQVTWRARHFGLTWHLTTTISACTRPSYFVDEQVTGPFRRWHHAHTFEPANDGAATLMTDVVDFAAPLPPLGTLAEFLVLKRYLTRLILLRNAHIKDVTRLAR
ncbi:ligand-binding SRPBCC domain-containing protein [Nonomuraea thailandensis]|uniref:Ligand-binding SRPBCC domain-containing protein n=1 Tax=Nonomuraea thailandensis TaxID=1188745 RepID=A0A9X2GAQ0_9ACTN|nr:SRPBCC family protein [Nonomuraea thailandensis]MCP2355506.1 ligand-binding SRPBCC domain-containing protein [Nonomuraea thailandensis]